MALRANGAGAGREFPVTGFDGLREAEKRQGVDGGDGATVGESNGNFRRSDAVWEFGDGQEVETAGGEKCGMDGAAKFLNGSANHGEMVLRNVGQVFPGLSRETYLEAVAGHHGLDSGGGHAVWEYNPAPL